MAEQVMPNKAFQTDELAMSHLLQKTQKLRHGNFAAEQRRLATQAATFVLPPLLKTGEPL
jgi:hypothetical protein